MQRGLDVIEFACGIPHALKGEYTQGAGPGIDVYSMRQPLGIGAGITPFNFPAMIPMWMFGVAVAAGNAFILKPSERDPSVPTRLAELFVEAGAPEGVLQVVHGDKEMVDAILDHPDIAGVSFVGSSDIAHYVYKRGVAAGKRVQAMGGAKNHGIVMPDADMDQVGERPFRRRLRFGRGERCMALPVVVPVGEETADRLRDALIPAINALRVGISTDEEAHYGPVVTGEHKRRVERWIDTAEEEGGEIVIDGRGFSLQGHEEGFFIGPTLIDRVTPQMSSYQEEIFGPVLQIVRAESFEEAVRAAFEASIRQRRRDLHPQRPRRARVRAAGECRHGRDQRADPGAGRLSQLRRLEALGLRRYRPARDGGAALLDQAEDGDPALARWRGRRRRRLRHPDDGVMGMRNLLFASLALALAACAASDEPADETMMPVEPDGGIGDGATPLAEPTDERASRMMPAALRGQWREDDLGRDPTEEDCDQTSSTNQNFGKVLTVRADGLFVVRGGWRHCGSAQSDRPDDRRDVRSPHAKWHNARAARISLCNQTIRSQ